MTTTIDAKIVEFTRLGWDASLHWRAPMGNWDTFVAVTRAAGRYNAFDGDAVADTFFDLFNDAADVEFGREGSPVMYVSVPFFPHQRHGSDHTCANDRYTDEQRQEFAARVIAWARTLRADEISVQQFPAAGGDVWDGPGPSPYRVRLWWD
ncbi:hypothetical protein [Nocardia sp. Marseille-Q1738]